MIIYNPQDATSEIIFNLGAVAYEFRRLAAPDASFILGEWVGLAANFTAEKIDGTGHVLPRMIWTPTDRHDTKESEGVTVAVGYFHLSTMNYVTGESFAVGDELVVLTNASIGKLAKYDASVGASTVFIVGAVRQAPAVDGTDRLIAEIFSAPQTIVIPAP